MDASVVFGRGGHDSAQLACARSVKPTLHASVSGRRTSTRSATRAAPLATQLEAGARAAAAATTGAAPGTALTARSSPSERP
jgi:hypothetical protein